VYYYFAGIVAILLSRTLVPQNDAVNRLYIVNGLVRTDPSSFTDTLPKSIATWPKGLNEQLLALATDCDSLVGMHFDPLELTNAAVKVAVIIVFTKYDILFTNIIERSRRKPADVLENLPMLIQFAVMPKKMLETF